MSLSIEFLPSHRDLPDALWEACIGPPLEGRWWYAALEESGLDQQFTFLYGLISEDGKPVGIAPAFVTDLPIDLVMPPELVPMFRVLGKVFPSLSHQRTLFLGSPCSDEGTLGLLPGIDRRAAMQVIQSALERQARQMNAPVVVWKDFPTAATGDDFAWLMARCRLFGMECFPGTEVALPSNRAEDYYASVKASRRHALKRKLKRSAEAVTLDVEVVQNPDPALLDQIFALFWQTYEKSTTRFETLNRRVFDHLAAAPSSHFILLRERASGDLVAFMLVFDMGEKVINKFIGIDYARSRDWALYFVLWDALVRWAAPRGAKTIQSGQTGYSAKIEMGHTLVPMISYCRHRNVLLHKIFAWVAKSITWASLDKDLAIYLTAHPKDGPAPDS